MLFITHFLDLMNTFHWHDSLVIPTHGRQTLHCHLLSEGATKREELLHIRYSHILILPGDDSYLRTPDVFIAIYWVEKQLNTTSSQFLYIYMCLPS